MEKTADENIVWHYTKMETLEKIFPPKYKYIHKINKESNLVEEHSKDNEEYFGKIKLRFTNIRLSKDPTELLILKSFIKKNKYKILEKIEDNDCKRIFEEEVDKDFNAWDNNYSFSASRLRDSTAFWNREYAGLNGISIGIDRNVIKKYNTEYFYSDGFDDICYLSTEEVSDDEIIKVLKDINACYKGSGLPKDKNIENYGFLNFFMNVCSSSYKSKSWEHEGEARIILNAFKDKELPQKREFENGRIIKVKYLFFDKNIVKSIILGPDCTDEQVEAVEKYLNDNGYEGISVSLSCAFDLRYKGNPKE